MDSLEESGAIKYPVKRETLGNQITNRETLGNHMVKRETLGNQISAFPLSRDANIESLREEIQDISNAQFKLEKLVSSLAIENQNKLNQILTALNTKNNVQAGSSSYSNLVNTAALRRALSLKSASSSPSPSPSHFPSHSRPYPNHDLETAGPGTKRLDRDSMSPARNSVVEFSNVDSEKHLTRSDSGSDTHRVTVSACRSADGALRSSPSTADSSPLQLEEDVLQDFDHKPCDV